MTKISKGRTVALKDGVDLWRKTTDAEKKAWYDSDASKGMTSGGDTKIHSGTSYARADGAATYTVVRARCAPMKGWHRMSKCVEVKDAEGTLWYVRRAHVAVLA